MKQEIQNIMEYYFQTGSNIEDIKFIHENNEGFYFAATCESEYVELFISHDFDNIYEVWVKDGAEGFMHDARVHFFTNGEILITFPCDSYLYETEIRINTKTGKEVMTT